MIFGAIASIVSLMLLAWTPMITWKVAKVLHHFGIDIDVTTNQIIVMSLTVFMLHMLDLCLNLLQAAAHALIVDTAPALQSNFANAWASRVGGVGNIAGFALAYVKFST